MRIITVTMNVAVDQTISLDRLVPGQVHRARSVRYTPGGKGVIVSACLARWGLKVQASGFLGDKNAGIFEDLFRAKGIEDRFVRLDGVSRTNVKLVDSVDTTDINLPGISVEAASIRLLEAELGKLAQGGGIAVLAGSLPSGCPADIYARLTQSFSRAGFKVILDASGAALKEALSGEIMPYCVKPNRDELAEWAGEALNSAEALVDRAKALLDGGIKLVVVSMGREGALFASQEGVLTARATADVVVSTVGAGDAMVAGISAATHENAGLERTARLATAFSIGKLSLPGAELPGPAELEAIAGKVEVRFLK